MYATAAVVESPVPFSHWSVWSGPVVIEEQWWVDTRLSEIPTTVENIPTETFSALTKSFSFTLRPPLWWFLQHFRSHLQTVGVFFNSIPSTNVFEVCGCVTRGFVLMHLHVVGKKNKSICKNKWKFPIWPLISFLFCSLLLLSVFAWHSQIVHKELPLGTQKMKRHKHFEMVTRLFTYHPIPPGLISVKAEKPGVEWHCLPAWAHKFRFEWEWRALLYCDCGTNRCLNGCMKLFSVLIVAYFYSPHTTGGEKRARERIQWSSVCLSKPLTEWWFQRWEWNETRSHCK